MKKIMYLLLLLFIIPLNVFAISSDYKDNLSDITNAKIEDEKINLYIFYGRECPHCEELFKYLDTLSLDDVNVIKFEVWHDEDNKELLNKVSTKLGVNVKSVPFSVVGDKMMLGFSDTTKNELDKALNHYLGREVNPNNYNIPLLGKIDTKDVSISLVGIVLGLVDGFNPCAMWVLLFLINMMLPLKNKKKMFLLGFTFLFMSAFVYFLSMLGISVILNVTTIFYVRVLIAIVAIFLGLSNIIKYIKTRKDSGCKVIDAKKRKKIFTKINKFINEKNMIFALLGVTLLAISVNLIELACSLGFPAIFSEILSLNNITGFKRVIYLVVYVLFYMLDDLIVFTIAVLTLKLKTSSSKISKYINLISGIIMVIMGILLIFKVEWIMFNF